MNVARATATRAHQRLGICPLPPVVLYAVTVLSTYTAYSCQVMTSTEASEAERTRLSKAAVIDRALAIGDAEGLDAVTIRRVANELGVTPMALYWHFRAKDQLLAGLAERVWGEIDT